MVRFSELFKKKGEPNPPTPNHRPKPAPGGPVEAKKETVPRIRTVRAETPGTTSPPPLSERPVEKPAGTVNFRQVMERLPGITPPTGSTVSSPIPVSPPPSPPSVREEIRLADIIRQENQEKGQRARTIYLQLGETAWEIARESAKTKKPGDLNYTILLSPLGEAINLIITGDRSLLDLACQYSIEEYLKFHLVNVGIISLYLGVTQGFNKYRLTELGALALLHENGAEETPEYQELENRTSGLLSVLRRIQQLGESILPILRRERGTVKTSLPASASGGAVTEVTDYAGLINLVNTYETLCRPKPYRKKMPPQQVIKELIEAGETFDKNLIKTFIKLIGLYPVGSWVELNTGEIACVAAINEKSPMRPVVHIIFDKEKQPIPEVKTLDLLSNQNIYIKGTIPEDDLKNLNLPL